MFNDFHESRDFLGRMIYAAFACWAVVAACFDPGNVAYALSRDWSGATAITALGLAAALLLLDMVVNDLLPEDVIFAWAYKRRPYVYLYSAFLYQIPLFVAARSGSVTLSAALLYGGMSLAGVSIAVRSVIRRHRYRFQKGTS